jgi:hypothetical protein
MEPDVARLDASTSVVHVVLAEPDAPGPLHYLLEAEGFHVVGTASDEPALRRILDQDVDPDVIVLDTDIPAASVLVARQQAPRAHVIVIWPDGVQAPPSTERIAPWLVYELLGPRIRHAVRARPPQRNGSAPEPSEQPSFVEVLDGTDAAPGSGTRVASRLTLASILLVAVVVATMGTAFALESWNVSKTLSLFGRGPSSSASVAVTHTSAPPPSPDVSDVTHDPGAAVPATGSCDPGTSPGSGNRNVHASANAGHQQRCDAGKNGTPQSPPAHHKPNHHAHGTTNGQGQPHKPVKSPSPHAHQGSQGGNGGGGDGPNGPPAESGGTGGSGSSDAHAGNSSGH